MGAKILITKVLPACYKGDLAIAKSMLATISRCRPDWELSILCRRPIEDGDLFSPYGKVYGELFPSRESISEKVILIRVFRYLIWLFLKVPCLDRQGQDYINLCREADVLVFCGGGSPGGYGLTNLLLHAVIPILIAKRLGKPVFLSALTIELPKRRLERWLVRFILKQVDLVSLREVLSVDVLEQLGIETKRVVTADWAFLLDSIQPESVTPLLKKLGIPDSSSLKIGMNLRDQSAGDSDGRTRAGSSYAATMVEAIDEVLEQTQAIIVIVSMNVPADLKFARLISEQLSSAVKDRVFILDNSYSPEQIKGIISRMDLFIGTRLHPTIFAVSSKIPSLAIHHLIKVKGLMKQFGMERYFLEVDTLTSKEFNNKVQELLKQRENVNQEIERRLPQVEKASYNNVDLIESLLTK